MRVRTAVGAMLALLVLTTAACGGGDGTMALPLSGIVREPAPRVDATTLPSLTTPGDDVSFRADEGDILVVYYGFTNCPDVCPTTLADLTIALRKLDTELAERVDLMMVTVDPDRDLDLLDGYVTSFVPGAVAAGTADEQRLLASAEPFGASWEVRSLADGSVEVDHTGFLYAIDDAGELVLTWQFGASSDDMSNDLRILLERYDA